MECVLRISYKLDIGKHQARSEKDKVSASLKKKKMQEQMKQQLGLVTDIPKSDGSGTSNDGNASRRFFKNAQIVYSITGFDLHLIKTIHVVLQILSSGLQIDPDAFQMYRKIGRLWPYGMALAQAKFLFKNGLKSIPQGMPVNVY